MTLDFNDDRTYTKDVVLKNVRYALFDPKSLQDDAFFAKFLDMAVVFVLMDHSDPNRPRYKIVDAVDMVSLDIRLNEIMDAANANCKKVGYRIMPMEDAISEIIGIEIPSDAPYLQKIRRKTFDSAIHKIQKESHGETQSNCKILQGCETRAFDSETQ